MASKLMERINDLRRSRIESLALLGRKGNRPILNEIAKQTLGIETLETQNADFLDFHDCAVWAIREALALAYLAGIEHERHHGNHLPYREEKP